VDDTCSFCDFTSLSTVHRIIALCDLQERLTFDRNWISDLVLINFEDSEATSLKIPLTHNHPPGFTEFTNRSTFSTMALEKIFAINKFAFLPSRLRVGQ
jgi:hypothetical protein